MLQKRWTYSNGGPLTRAYGHVDYCDRYVVGQWFALDSDTGPKSLGSPVPPPNHIPGLCL